MMQFREKLLSSEYCCFCIVHIDNEMRIIVSLDYTIVSGDLNSECMEKDRKMAKVEAPLSSSSCCTHMFCGASIFDIFPSYLNSDTCEQFIHSDNKKSDMPKEFSIELKAVYFQVIDFGGKENNGSTIPLNLTTARFLALLGISGMMENVEYRGAIKHVGATGRCGKWRLYFRHFSVFFHAFAI